MIDLDRSTLIDMQAAAAGAQPSGVEQVKWLRYFNRLEAAISHHRKAKEDTGFCDDADEALHAAHDRILKEAAS